MKRRIAQILSIIWTLVLILQVLVWNVSLRESLFGTNSVVEMVASAMNDLLWIPIGLALPVYIVVLAQNRTNRRLVGFSLIAVAVVLVAALQLLIYFKLLFILILACLTLFLPEATRLRDLPTSVLIFTITLTLTINHYRLQLLPNVFDKHPALPVSVLSYNVKIDQTPEEHSRIIDYLKTRQPDIVCLQEFSTALRKRLRSDLLSLYPHQFYSKNWGDYNGGVILSKYRLENAKTLKIETSVSSAHINLIEADVVLGETQFRLYNCHLYHGAHHVKRLLLRRDEVEPLLRKAKSSYARHREEARLVFEQIQSSEPPFVLAGDLNDTPNSPVYRLFSTLAKDAFAAQGWGIGATYGQWTLKQSLPPFWHRFLSDFLRIDHIFCSLDVRIHDAQVVDLDASDHRPVLVRISF